MVYGYIRRHFKKHKKKYINTAKKYGRRAIGIGKSYIKKKVMRYVNGVSRRIRKSIKYGSSRTRTKKHVKARNRALEISQHNDLSEKGVKCLHHPRIKEFKHPAKFEYEVVKEGMTSRQSGEQLVYCPPYMFTRAQMNGETGNSRSAYGVWEADPFLLNPYSTMPVNSLMTGPAPAVAAADKLAIHSVTNNLAIMNMETLPAEVYVGWYMCKKATSSLPDTWWTECLQSQQELQANQTTTGQLSVTTATGGSGTIYSRNMSPSGTYDFKHGWKYIGGEKFILQPGDQRNLKFHVQMNRVITKKYLSGTNELYMKGLTIVPMIIARPGLCSINKIVGDPPIIQAATEVTYGPSKIGFVSSMKMTFGALPVNRYNRTRLFSGELIGGENISGQILYEIDDTDTKNPVQQL